MQYDKLIRTSKNFKHPLFGMAIIKKDNNSKETYLRKTIKAKNSQELSSIIAIIQQRIDIQSENILKILDLDIDFENLQIHLLFQNPDMPLSQRINQLKKNFKEKQQFLLNILQGLFDLQKSEMVHGHISIDSIYYDQKRKQYQLIDKFLLEGVKNYDYLLKLKKNDKLYITPEITSYIGRQLQSLPFNPLTQDTFSLGMIFLEIVSSEKQLQQCYSIKKKQFSVDKLENLKKTIIEKYSKQSQFKILFKFVDNYLLQCNTLERPFPSYCLKIFQKYLQTNTVDINNMYSNPKEFEISKIHYIGNYFLGVQDKLKINYDQQLSLRLTKSEQKLIPVKCQDNRPYNILLTSPNLQQQDIQQLQDQIKQNKNFKKSTSKTSISRNSSKSSNKKDMSQDKTQKQIIKKSKSKGNHLNTEDYSQFPKRKHSVKKRKSFIVTGSDQQQITDNLLTVKIDDENNQDSNNQELRKSAHRKQSIRKVDSNEKIQLLQTNKDIHLDPNSKIYEHTTEIEEVDGDQIIRRTRRNTVQQQDFDIVEEEIEEESLNTSLFMEKLDENSEEVQNFLRLRNIKLENNQSVYRIEGTIQIVENQDMQIQIDEKSQKSLKDINQSLNNDKYRQMSEPVLYSTENKNIEQPKIYVNKENDKIDQNQKSEKEIQLIENQNKQEDLQHITAIQEKNENCIESQNEFEFPDISEQQSNQFQKKGVINQNETEEHQDNLKDKEFAIEVKKTQNDNELQKIEDQHQPKDQKYINSQPQMIDTKEKVQEEQYLMDKNRNKILQAEEFKEQNQNFQNDKDLQEDQEKYHTIGLNKDLMQTQQKEQDATLIQQQQNQDTKLNDLLQKDQNNERDDMENVVELQENQFQQTTLQIKAKNSVLQKTFKEDADIKKIQNPNHSKLKKQKDILSSMQISNLLKEFQKPALELIQQNDIVQQISQKQKLKIQKSEKKIIESQSQQDSQTQNLNQDIQIQQKSQKLLEAQQNDQIQKNLEEQGINIQEDQDKNIKYQQDNNVQVNKMVNQKKQENKIQNIFTKKPQIEISNREQISDEIQENVLQNNVELNSLSDQQIDDSQILSMLIQKNQEEQELQQLDDNLDQYITLQNNQIDEYGEDNKLFFDTKTQDDTENTQKMNYQTHQPEYQQIKEDTQAQKEFQKIVLTKLDNENELQNLSNDEIQLQQQNIQPKNIAKTKEDISNKQQDNKELKNFPKYFFNYESEQKYTYLKRKKRGSRRIKATSTKDITKTLQSFAYPNQEDLFKKFSSTRHVQIPVFKKKDAPVSIDSQMTDKINENIFERAFDIEIEKQKKQEPIVVKSEPKQNKSVNSSQSIGTQTNDFQQKNICDKCKQNKEEKNINENNIALYQSNKKTNDDLAKQFLQNFRTNKRKTYNIDTSFLIYINDSESQDDVKLQEQKKQIREFQNFKKLINQKTIINFEEKQNQQILQEQFQSQIYPAQNMQKFTQLKVSENINIFKNSHQLQVIQDQHKNKIKKFSVDDISYTIPIKIEQTQKCPNIFQKYFIVKKEKHKSSYTSKHSNFLLIPSKTNLRFYDRIVQKNYQTQQNVNKNQLDQLIQKKNNSFSFCNYEAMNIKNSQIIKDKSKICETQKKLIQASSHQNSQTIKNKSEICETQKKLIQASSHESDIDMKKIQQQKDEIYKQLQINQSYSQLHESSQLDQNQSSNQFYYDDKELEQDLKKRRFSDKVQQFKIFVNNKQDNSFIQDNDSDKDSFEENQEKQSNKSKNKLFYDETQIKDDKETKQKFYKSQTLKFQKPENKQDIIDLFNDDMSVFTQDPELRHMIEILKKHKNKQNYLIAKPVKLVFQQNKILSNMSQNSQKVNYDMDHYFSYQRLHKQKKLREQNFIQLYKQRQEIKQKQICQNYTKTQSQSPKQTKKQNYDINQNQTYLLQQKVEINQKNIDIQSNFISQLQHKTLQQQDIQNITYQSTTFKILSKKKQKSASKINESYSYSNQYISVQKSKSSSHSNQNVQKNHSVQFDKKKKQRINKFLYFFIKPKYEISPIFQKNYEFQQNIIQRQQQIYDFIVLQKQKMQQEQQQKNNLKTQNNYRIQQHIQKENQIQEYKLSQNNSHKDIIEQEKDRDINKLEDYMLLLNSKQASLNDKPIQKFKPKRKSRLFDQQKIFRCVFQNEDKEEQKQNIKQENILEDFMVFLKVKQNKKNDFLNIKSFRPRRKSRLFDQQKIFNQVFDKSPTLKQSSVILDDSSELQSSKKDSINLIQDVEIYKKNKIDHSLSQNQDYQKMFKKSKTQQDIYQFKNYLIRQKRLKQIDTEHNYEFSMTSSKNNQTFDKDQIQKREKNYQISKIKKILEQDSEISIKDGNLQIVDFNYSQSFSNNLNKKSQVQKQQKDERFEANINLYEQNDPNINSFEQMLQQFQNYSNFISSQSSILIKQIKSNKNSICNNCQSILDDSVSRQSFAKIQNQNNFQSNINKVDQIIEETKKDKQKRKLQIKKNYNFVGYLDLNPSEPSSMRNLQNFQFNSNSKNLHHLNNKNESQIDNIFRSRKISDTQQIYNQNKETHNNKQIKTKVNPIKRPNLDNKFNLYQEYTIKKRNTSPKPDMSNLFKKNQNKSRNNQYRNNNIQSERIQQQDIKQSYSPALDAKRSLRNSLLKKYQKQNTAITNTQNKKKLMNKTHDLSFQVKQKQDQVDQYINSNKQSLYNPNIFKKQLIINK